MEPIVMMSARDLVAEKLREEIYTGKLAPGEELIQEKISAKLGVSRMPVREAILLLSSADMVEIQKNKRAVVKRISADDIAEYLEIRSLLECRAGIKACRKAANFAPLEEMHRELLATADQITREQFRLMNTRFHHALWALAESPTLARVLRQTWHTTPTPYPTDLPGHIQRNIQEHGAIIQALQARDEQKVIDSIGAHISATREIVVSLLNAADVADRPQEAQD